MSDHVIDLRDPDAQHRIERRWHDTHDELTRYRAALELIAELGDSSSAVIALDALGVTA